MISKSILLAVIVSLATICLQVSQVDADEKDEKKAGATKKKNAAFYDFTVKDIDGHDVKLEKYRGDVLLVVNVASMCGLTDHNYKYLEPMYRDYKDQGFKVLAFPANNFGSQEPGTHEQIKQFCKSKYDVTFPLFAKVSVKGDDICPLYTYLTQETPEDLRGPIKWNFQKYLISRDGQVVARFMPTMSDDSAEIREKIETLLKAPRLDRDDKS